MRHKRMFGTLLLAGMLFACSEGMGPEVNGDDVLLSNTPNMVKWGFDAPPGFSIEGDGVEAGTFGDDSPPLASSAEDAGVFQYSFWAVRGITRQVGIYTVDYSEGYARYLPFLYLGVTDPVERPDGSQIAVGDSVVITISIDRTTMQTELTPHGLRFGESAPTNMRLYYAGALGDFNGDGVVNQEDSDLESKLSVWYQADAESKWAPINATQYASNDYFQLYLDHFSGYGVAW